MRLGFRQTGICLCQSQFPREQGLRQPLHRRQPGGARDRRSRPAGGRKRARTADRGGREAMGRARLRVRGRHEQGHAQADRPHVPFWRTRGRCGRDQARQGAGAQEAGPVQVHRPAAGAARRAAQDQRLGEVRHRSRGAGHGPGRDHQMPRVRRHGEIGRREQDRRAPRHPPGGQAQGRRRGRGGSLLSRADRAQ